MSAAGMILKGFSAVLSAFLLMSQPSATFAADASYQQIFSNQGATGEDLANAFFDLLSSTGSPSGTVGTTAEQDEASRALVKPYLDSAFLLQRASGERNTVDNYVPADVDEFEIGDVTETRPADDVRVVRYFIRATETLPTSALVMSKDKAPRLTVFHWNSSDSRWKILSHANFNTPIAAICDKDPIADNGVESAANPADQALGEALIGKFYELIMKGDALPILHPEIQFQSASGIGYARLVNRPAASKYDELHFDNAVVTRNGRLIAVSTYTTAKKRDLMHGNQLRGGSAPNLSTFILSDDGSWRLIAVASFAPLKDLPAGTECVPSGKLENAP